MPFNLPLNDSFDPFAEHTFGVMLDKYFMEAYFLIDTVIKGRESVGPSSAIPGYVPGTYLYNYTSLCLTIQLFKKVRALLPSISSENRLQAMLRQLALHQTIDTARAIKEGWMHSEQKRRPTSGDLIRYVLSRK